jgi:hypothetical protein
MIIHKTEDDSTTVVAIGTLDFVDRPTEVVMEIHDWISTR